MGIAPGPDGQGYELTFPELDGKAWGVSELIPGSLPRIRAWVC